MRTMRMLSFPEEVAFVVVSQLSRRDVANLRLASRALCSIVDGAVMEVEAAPLDVGINLGESGYVDGVVENMAFVLRSIARRWMQCRAVRFHLRKAWQWTASHRSHILTTALQVCRCASSRVTKLELRFGSAYHLAGIVEAGVDVLHRVALACPALQVLYVVASGLDADGGFTPVMSGLYALAGLQYLRELRLPEGEWLEEASAAVPGLEVLHVDLENRVPTSAITRVGRVQRLVRALRQLRELKEVAVYTYVSREVPEEEVLREMLSRSAPRRLRVLNVGGMDSPTGDRAWRRQWTISSSGPAAVEDVRVREDRGIDVGLSEVHGVLVRCGGGGGSSLGRPRLVMEEAVVTRPKMGSWVRHLRELREDYGDVEIEMLVLDTQVGGFCGWRW